MDQDDIIRYGNALYDCLRQRKTMEPLTDQTPDIAIADAYQIALRLLQRRLDDGERVIGKKIGATSKAVQNLLKIDQPDFGYLTDRMMYDNDAEVPVSSALIQPKAEGEIAFILKRDLQGPGVTNAEALRATECVMPCFEVVDSRIWTGRSRSRTPSRTTPPAVASCWGIGPWTRARWI